MGAERKENEAGSTRRKRNTDPGVGPPSAPGVPAAPAGAGAGGEGAADAASVNGQVSQDDDEPSVVDFDALNAALGALPPPPTSSSPMASDSQGRSSATYASSRPHTIPPSHAPIVIAELNAPAVIVKSDDTIPSGPPQMTLPMGPGIVSPAAGMRPPSPSSPSHPFTPQPMPVQAPPSSDKVNLTLPMGERPRRPRSATIVVRTRGPTKVQKALVFVAMLIVFLAGGVAVLVYNKVINLDALMGTSPAATRTQAPSPAPPPASSPPLVPTVTVSALPSAVPSAAPSATGATKKPFPRLPR